MEVSCTLLSRAIAKLPIQGEVRVRITVEGFISIESPEPVEEI